MKVLGKSEIVEYGLSIARPNSTSITQENMDVLSNTLHQFVNKMTTIERASEVFKSIAGTTRPVEVVCEIIKESMDPKPLFAYVFDKKTPRHWSAHEDTRLLAGVYLFGSSDWGSISNFVGANRSKAQCLQRWTRTLSPNITKNVWTPEEESRLCSFVAQASKVSWTKIAHQMGNRSDVQCRYHFSQLVKNKQIEYKQVPIYDSYRGSAYKQVPVLASSEQQAQLPITIPSQEPCAIPQKIEIQQQQHQIIQPRQMLHPLIFSFPQQQQFLPFRPIIFGLPVVSVFQQQYL